MIECAYLPFVSISPPCTRCEDEWEHEMHLFADSRPVVVMADDGVSRWSAAPDAANPTLGRNVYLSFRCHYRYHAIIDPLPVQAPRIFTSLQFFIHFLWSCNYCYVGMICVWCSWWWMPASGSLEIQIQLWLIHSNICTVSTSQNISCVTWAGFYSLFVCWRQQLMRNVDKLRLKLYHFNY